MIMPLQQRPPQQSGLSLPLQHSIHCIHCGATTNFNVNVWSTTVGSLHEFLFAKYKMKYIIQYFQTGDILIPSGFSREFSSENRKTGNEKVTNAGNSRNRDPGFQTLVLVLVGLEFASWMGFTKIL